MSSVPFGFNVFGHVFSESGVGEHTRLLIASLRAAGVPHSVVPLASNGSRQLAEFAAAGPATPIYPVHILSMNADQVESFYRERGPGIFADRYTIGLWAWEVEEFPEWLAAKAEYVDEIWANSNFSARAIASQVDKPVFSFTLPVAEPAGPFVGRAELNLPAGYLVLFVFDFDSVAARKNPVGAVRAFRGAFAPGEGPRLLIKTVNAERHPREAAELRAAAADRPDIEIRDGYLSPGEQRSLMNACDLYLSLHRSEGFGLTLAEAMALGKPLVATAYSGNLDFMSDDTGFLVPFRLVEIGPGRAPYPAFGRWAEPDIASAARALREAWESPDEARKRGARARTAILREHGVAARGAFLCDRAAAISAILAAGWRRRPVTVTAEKYAEALLLHGPQSAPLGPWSRRLRNWAEHWRRADREHRRELDRALLAHPRQVATEVAGIVARQERAELDRWVAELTRRVEALEGEAAREAEAARPPGCGSPPEAS